VGERWRETTFSQCVARVATRGHFTVPVLLLTVYFGAPSMFITLLVWI
jgi:hypothetical protein